MDGGGRGGEQEPRFVAPRQDAVHTAPTQNAHFTFDAYPRDAARNSELDMRKHFMWYTKVKGEALPKRRWSMFNSIWHAQPRHHAVHPVNADIEILYVRCWVWHGKNVTLYSFKNLRLKNAARGGRTGSPSKLLKNCDMTDADNTDGKKYVMGDVWALCFLCLCRVSGRVAGGCGFLWF